MSRHTSGPWMVTEIEDCYCVANCGRYVIVPEHGKVKADNSAADARLIAAAPELLEALIEVTASLAWNAHGECRAVHEGPIMPSAMAIETARAAIAKACGH